MFNAGDIIQVSSGKKFKVIYVNIATDEFQLQDEYGQALPLVSSSVLKSNGAFLHTPVSPPPTFNPTYTATTPVVGPPPLSGVIQMADLIKDFTGNIFKVVQIDYKLQTVMLTDARGISIESFKTLDSPAYDQSIVKRGVSRPHDFKVGDRVKVKMGDPRILPEFYGVEGVVTAVYHDTIDFKSDHPVMILGMPITEHNCKNWEYFELVSQKGSVKLCTCKIRKNNWEADKLWCETHHEDAENNIRCKAG